MSRPEDPQEPAVSGLASPATSLGSEGSLVHAAQAEFADQVHFIVLAQIGNYASLRRHLGVKRSRLLIDDVIDRISASALDVETTVLSRNRCELVGVVRSSDRVEAIMRELGNRFAEPFLVDGEKHHIELIMGAAYGRSFYSDEPRLIEEAEAALDDALQRKTSVAREATQQPRWQDRAVLARDLHRAVARDELFLQYQPKLHVRQQRVTSVEALIRWQHPTRGLVLPGEFIELAEETRDIDQLTTWTIRQALADQRRMAGGGHDVPVFINIAGLLLSDESFVAEAIAIIGADGAKLGFEITETSVIDDPDVAIENLKRFANLGVTIAIDDYGAGLSSLAYLKKLPASELKIDKLFVTQLTSSNRDPLIVRSTIDLAHALEMSVVAEGVETAAALALLSVMGCDMVQGFFISRPIGLEALLTFLADDPTEKISATGLGLFSGARAGAAS